MTVYPNALDDDQTLIRVDANITEIGGTAINQIRSAIFAIERELGLNPSGSAGSVANRLDVSLNPNGTIKTSALTSVGLATLPITNNQVANNAGIKEFKLDLDFNTSDLNTAILANSALLTSLSAFATITNSNLLAHIAGATTLADGSTSARHVASHIDINSVPSDSRDVSFIWDGLKDKDGVDRGSIHVAEALLDINDALVTHENATADAHSATAITVDTSDFDELPLSADTVQKALDAIDDSETLLIGIHRANSHSNGVPRKARSEDIKRDGYNQQIVEPTPARAFLVQPPASSPVDNNVQGDDVIQFLPNNTGFAFDAQFSQVKIGDHLRINYGNGLEGIFLVESSRFLPGSDWFVRVNGYNLFNTDGYDAYARIDRPLYDTNTAGVLAVAASNNNISTATPPSFIVGHPRGAVALGLGFEPGQLDSTHYNLYLQIYPTGNPTEQAITLPAIDVTGNSGATPGRYTLNSVVQSTNDALRAAGFNYRFIAFAHEGEFGIMLADPIDCASFSIVNGSISGTSVVAGTFPGNVIGDDSRGGSPADGQDALGFGSSKADLASPEYSATFASSEIASNLATKIIFPAKNRNYIVNGIRRDDLLAAPLTVDGYWPATITSRVLVGVTTVETTYTVEMDLRTAELKVGKTLVVQPEVAIADASYNFADYGRFIIKEVNFTDACDAPPTPATTTITVINGVHATADPIGTSSGPGLEVKLYFSEDSVSFNNANMVEAAPPSDEYNRLHKIYVDEDGKTFSHERARMIKQSETVDLLATSDGWTVKDASPKLRGFLDDGATDFRRYVRFYVTNYDGITGEYDGYIGKRVVGSPGISEAGAITRSRKNVPARFYDSSNLDYIELEFTELVSSPGTAIMSTTSPRFVDIEIFPDFSLDKEVFLLATAEVDNDTVECVVDRRDFGNTSEKDFTTGAIDFIRASDRHLHANAVLRGLTFEGADPSDDSVLFFDGGLAIVNGAVVAVNSGKVEIPEISEFGDALPDTVTWAVCVNETGQFETIIITPTKEEFFGVSGASNFYVPSVTFPELIAARKDLTVIHLVTVTIASLTLDEVRDARRFANSSDMNIPLTWVPDPLDQAVIGHFNNFEALETWVNNYGSLNNTVKVRGQFTIDSDIGPINLTGLSFPVTFEGENAEFIITSDSGFLLDSEITFKNIKFSYAPTGISYTALNLIDADVGEGCLILSGAGDTAYSDIVIENCIFSKNADELNRPPFILFDIQNGDVLDSIKIRDNLFGDDVLTHRSNAITIRNAATGSTTAAVVVNCEIDNNICGQEQSIWLGSVVDSVSSEFEVPGLNVVNTRISNNQCGAIGYLTSNDASGRNFAVRGTAGRGYGLIIEGNTTMYIGRMSEFGLKISAVSDFPLYNYGPGPTVIRNNHAHWIHAYIGVDDSADQYGPLVIQENILDGYDQTYLTAISGVLPLQNWAIGVDSVFDSGDSTHGHAEIANNTIDFGVYDGTVYGYETGIMVATQSTNGTFADANQFPQANIHDNHVAGLNDSATAVYFSIGIATLSAENNIQGNKIFRSSNSIANYIRYIGSASSEGLIVDNYFDEPTTNGTITATMIVAGDTWTLDRNKNHTVTLNINTFSGSFDVRPSVLGADGFITGDYAGIISGTISDVAILRKSNVVAPLFEPETVVFRYEVGSASGSVQYNWFISLEDILPKDVFIIESSVRASSSGTTDFGQGFLAIVDGATTTLSNIIDFTTTVGPSLLIASPPTETTHRVGTTPTYLQVSASAIDSSVTVEVEMTDLSVTYRW